MRVTLVRSPWFLAVALVCNLACKSETPSDHEASGGQPAETETAPGAAGEASGGVAAPTGQGQAAAGAAGGPEAEAKQIFESRCTPCHGADGSGSGPVAQALQPKPRDFRDPEWQKSVTDEHIEKIIAGGGPAVGKAPTMPPNPDLAEKKEVIAALRAIVRGMKK